MTRRGMTVIELLLAMGITATLAAIATPRVDQYINKAKVAHAIGDISAVQVDILGFAADNGRLPNSLSEIGRGGMEDPWDRPYQYLNIQDMKGKGAARKDRFLVPLNSDFDLYSMGRDGASVPPLAASSSQDDIIRANDGGYIGLAERY